MELITFVTGPLENNSYLAIEHTNCVLFDAPIQSFEKIVDYITKNHLNLHSIILTHTHFDHIVDLSLFNDNFKPEIYVHQKDAYRIISPKDELPTWVKLEIEPVTPTKYLNDNEIIEIENMFFKILHTPGHTQGGVCIELIGENKIITGDTLFNLGVGRSDFPGGDSLQLISSIRDKLLTYPDDYEIFPGHGGKSTIGIEKKFNPFLKNV